MQVGVVAGAVAMRRIWEDTVGCVSGRWPGADHYAQGLSAHDAVLLPALPSGENQTEESNRNGGNPPT